MTSEISGGRSSTLFGAVSGIFTGVSGWMAKGIAQPFRYARDSPECRKLESFKRKRFHCQITSVNAPVGTLDKCQSRAMITALPGRCRLGILISRIVVLMRFIRSDKDDPEFKYEGH